MFGSVDKLVIYGVVGLGMVIVTGLIVREIVELFRRWFIKPEYPCEKCGSRFTLLSGKWIGIDSGRFYKTHCLVCGHNSSYKHTYFKGKGRYLGGRWIGWKKISLSAAIAEEIKIAEILRRR